MIISDLKDHGDGLGKTGLKWCGAADKARRAKPGTVSPQSWFSAFLEPNQSCSPAIRRQFLLNPWGCCYQNLVLGGAEPIQSTDVSNTPWQQDIANIAHTRNL